MNELTIRNIQDNIITLPNRPPFMLAPDVAVAYGVKTKHVNQAVKRNPERFPQPDFCFQLTSDEWEGLRSQDRTFQNINYLPWGFPEPGCNMLSVVLRSPAAVARSVHILRAFTAFNQLARRSQSGVDLVMNGLALFEEMRENMPELPEEYKPVIRQAVREARQEGAVAGINIVQALRKSGLPGNFVERLATYRCRGNTQRETAKLLDVSRDTVQRYERMALQAGMIRKIRKGRGWEVTQ